MKVVLTEAARLDLMSQIDWLVRLSPAAARKAADRIESGLLRLADFPLSGPPQHSGFREARIRFGRDGFVVRYHVEGDAVVILRLFHGRQER